VLKSGESISKKIEPASPMPLSDGDILTFGKEVGRDIDIVRPVSARIKIHIQSNSDPQHHQSMDLTDEIIEISYRPPQIRKPSTGRYGVARLSSSSPSSSDIEEIDGPEILPVRPSSHEDDGKSARGIGLLKHILPQINFPTTSSRSSTFCSTAYELPGPEPADNKHVYSLLSDHQSDISAPPSPLVTGPDASYQQYNCDDIIEVEPSVIGAWPNSPVSPISRAESPLVWESFMPPEVTEIFDESPEPSHVENQGNSIPIEASLEVTASEQRMLHDLERSPSSFHFDNNTPRSGNRSGSEKEDNDVPKAATADVELKEQVFKIKDTVDQVFVSSFCHLLFP
jgi:hypothetical protein